MLKLLESLPKNRAPIFATHSGTFHCDEVVAISMLRMLVPHFTLIRSRSDEELRTADVVVDVGGVFDPATLRFDHHQRGFDDYFSDQYRSVTKLSSAGLVFKYFGRDLLQRCFGVQDSMLEKAFLRVYHNFICSVDAIDNGVDIAAAPKYKVSTDLASRVSRKNPGWNESGSDENERFRAALDVATEEINAQIHAVVSSWLPARVLVEEAVHARLNFHPSGKVIRLKQFCPWVEHLQDIEDETDGLHILFCVFEDQGGQFRVRAMPAARGSFENRLSLPENMRGLRDAELCEKAGISDLTFVHHSGFIGGTRTEAAAIALIEKTLKL
jgi:uncharacterized UPF0160 family protein